MGERMTSYECLSCDWDSEYPRLTCPNCGKPVTRAKATRFTHGWWIAPLLIMSCVIYGLIALWMMGGAR